MYRAENACYLRLRAAMHTLAPVQAGGIPSSERRVQSGRGEFALRQGGR